jgi:hypothetical protein
MGSLTSPDVALHRMALLELVAYRERRCALDAVQVTRKASARDWNAGNRPAAAHHRTVTNAAVRGPVE